MYKTLCCVAEGETPDARFGAPKLKFFLFFKSTLASDLEDKLQTYNKINGAIRRHFGK